MTHGYSIDAAGNRVLLLFCANDIALVRAAGAQAEALCNWSGADILAVVSPHGEDWRAHFWNPDGTEESLCGNALRAAAKVLCAPGERSKAITSRHAYVFGSTSDQYYFEAARSDVDVLDRGDGQLDVDPGTPHRIVFCDSLDDERIAGMARFVTEGHDPRNLTVAAWSEERRELQLRTIERGAGETGSCASGALSAFVALTRHRPDIDALNVSFRSGERLFVSGGRETIVVSGGATILDSFAGPCWSDIHELASTVA